MRRHAAVLLCSVLCSVLCSAVPADEAKTLLGRAFFVVADPAAAPSVALPAAAPRDGPVAQADEADLITAATGLHKSHHSEGHKGKKGGKKSYKAGYIKGHHHKDKKGYHNDDHHEKHSFGDYAEGHHSKHKGGGGKDYKGSEHKEKHKGGYKKGKEGAKGKKFGHKGKYHKGHHDKGFKHKEDHDAHGHKHDDQHKKVTGKYGSAYEEEEGYYKKGKGKQHKGGKFAGGKTWDYKGGDSFSISGKYHEDYSDVKGKYGFHGEELHKHKKGAKGGHKSGKSHKKGDAHKGHKGHDHKAHHSHYAPVQHSLPPAHGDVNRQGVAYSAPVASQKRSHSSPSHSKNLPVESTVDETPGKSRQYHVYSPRHPQNSESKIIHRNQRQPQHSHRHPGEQRHGKPQILSHSPHHDPELRNENPQNKPDHVLHPNPKHPYRAPPSRQVPAKNPYVSPRSNPLLVTNAEPQTHYNPHNNNNPHVKLRHRIVPPNGPRKSPPRRPHPNSIRSSHHENGRGRLNVRHPKSISGTFYDNKPVHSSHNVPLYAPQDHSDSAARGHSQSASHPQHSHPPSPPPANHGSYSQPEIVVPQHSKPDHSEPSTQRYSKPHRGPKRGYRRGRPKTYKKPPVYENEVINEAPTKTYHEDNPSHLEEEDDGGSESGRDKEYSHYRKERPRYEKQEDSRRENRIREDDKYHKNSKTPKPQEYEDDRSAHDTPYQRRPPLRQHYDSDGYSEPEHEPQDSRKQYYDERRYPADNNHRGYNSNENEDSKPTYENRQQAIDKPRYAHREEPPREESDDSDGTPPHRSYQQHNRGHPRPYHRQTPSSEPQEEPPHEDSSRTPDQSQHQYREKDRPSDEQEKKTSVTQQSGGAPNKNQQRGFYFPTLGHPLGFSNFAVGASNVPSVGTHKKLEPAASAFSLGHSQFSFDTFGDFGKFMPLTQSNKRV